MDQARSEDPLELDRRIGGGRHVGKARRKLWDSCRAAGRCRWHVHFSWRTSQTVQISGTRFSDL